MGGCVWGDCPHPPTLHGTPGWLFLSYPGSVKDEGSVEQGVGVGWGSGWSPCSLGIELMTSGVKGLPVLGSWVGILRWAQWDLDLSSTPPLSPHSAVRRREEARPLPG